VGDGPPGLGAGSDDGLCDQFGAPSVVAAAEQVHEAPEAEPAAAALVFGARVDLARRYVAALATDGIVRGLIGPRESGRLWSRHVLNSAVVADLIEPDARIVDIGSGAGLPGIPLAIARPDCRVDLVEPLERRAQFLREMVELLELNHCRVVRGRAEDVVAECGGARVVTSRALAPLHRVAVWSAPLIAAGGWMVALKGQSAAEELARDRQALTGTGLVDAELMTVGTGIVDPATLVVRAQRNGDMSKTPRAGQRRRPRKPQKDPMGQRSGRQGSQ
jgi:16S rRNA (guanine527-N7)-methyltransferase